MDIAVHLYYDPESSNWGFRVPAFRIVGGGQQSREEAEQAALDAIAFTLEADSTDVDVPEDHVVEHFRLTLARAS